MQSREIKRVPLDFDWPLGETYDDNPYSAAISNCLACGGHGYSVYGGLLRDRWWGYAPLTNDSDMPPPWTVLDFTKSIVRQKVEQSPDYFRYGYLTIDEAVRAEAERMCNVWNGRWMNRLTPFDVEAIVSAGEIGTRGVDPSSDTLLEDVNRAMLTCMWASSLDHICIKARVERNGGELYCEVCGGDGEVFDPPEHKHLYNEWAGEELVGDGWQLWSPVNDAPISPVFESSDDLIDWIVDSDGMTMAQASALIHMMYVPTAIIADRRFLTSSDILDGEHG